MKKSYLPIDPDYYEIFEEEMKKPKPSLVYYFGEGAELNEARGEIERIIITEKKEEFLLVKPDQKVRLDRIITVNGIPGPAYDEYDSYANACLDCMGGMD